MTEFTSFLPTVEGWKASALLPWSPTVITVSPTTHSVRSLVLKAGPGLLFL